MNLKLIASLLLCAFVVFSCGDDDEAEPVVETCETTGITYTNTVADILNGSCAVAGCHVDGNEAATGFSLEGFEKASIAAGFGRMVGSISREDGFSPMPRNGDKLDQCLIDQVAAWIADGAPE